MSSSAILVIIATIILIITIIIIIIGLRKQFEGDVRAYNKCTLVIIILGSLELLILCWIFPIVR